MSKKAKLFTNVSTYVIILFLFLILVAGVRLLGNELLFNDNAALDNDSIDYIGNLQGINISKYQASKSDLEEPILTNLNYSQGNPKDESFDFQFTKEKGFKIEIIVKSIFSTPEVILFDLLRLNKGSWIWVIGFVNRLWRILLIIALVYFVRGLIDK